METKMNKRTCIKCYEKFEREDMIKYNDYLFCLGCYKKKEKKDEDWNKKQDEENKRRQQEQEETKYPLLKSLFPYFLVVVIFVLIIGGFWLYKRACEVSHCRGCDC